MRFNDQTNPTINRYGSDKFQASFSNVPGVKQSDLKLFDYFLRDIVFPDFNIQTFNSEFMGYIIRHPINKMNTELSQIQMNFKISEDFQNYMFLSNWLRNIRYSTVQPLLDGESVLRKLYIKSLTINFLDLKKRITNQTTFTNLFLLSLSSVSLIYGQLEEVPMTCNFSYEEIINNQYTTDQNI